MVAITAPIHKTFFFFISFHDIHGAVGLGAEGSLDVDGERATVDLLHVGAAVAAGVVGGAVEILAAVTGGDNHALVGKGCLWGRDHHVSNGVVRGYLYLGKKIWDDVRLPHSLDSS